jgi:molecular chaperone HtpG
MKKGQLQIHSQNILPIIKKWLYSEKDIFLRELVSNACDAMLKLSILKNQEPCAGCLPPRVDIKIDKEAKTITISDTGIGMLPEETEQYLSQIAFSGAEEFIKAYQASDAFIGHFGLGFYSSYMIAQKVYVHTLSYKKEAKAVIWSCDGTSEYELLEGSKTSVGTDVILFIDKENEEYLQEARLLEILKRFCLFFPYPIFLNDTLINNKEPLWLKNSAECSKEEYIEFYKLLYPQDDEPLFWVHLNVDYPFHVKGILYFPRVKQDLDITKNHVRLFCNRVFVSSDCKDILPEYLTLLKGAIDSPDIPLNVSRSYLQVDKTVKALSGHIAKKVIDTLNTLFKTDKERFFAVWPDCEVIVKLGILHDEKFAAKARECLVWKTTDDEFVTANEYLEASKDKQTIFYMNEGQTASHLLELYKQQGLKVLVAKTALDSAIMAHLEKEMQGVSFKRIDALASAHVIDASKENTLLDADGKTKATRIADFARASLGDTAEVEAQSLASGSIAGFISMKEEERRLRDYFARIAPENSASLFAKKTFIVNTNSPLIQNLYALHQTEPETAKLFIQHLYELALLGQNEMDQKQIKGFIENSHRLLERMSSAQAYST